MFIVGTGGCWGLQGPSKRWIWETAFMALGWGVEHLGGCGVLELEGLGMQRKGEQEVYFWD